MYASVILPLNIERVLSYAVPDQMQCNIALGCRVTVGVGQSRVYTAIVIELHATAPSTDIKYKNILSLVDSVPIIPSRQIKFWQWVSRYYLCSMGSVMKLFFNKSLLIEGSNSESGVVYSGAGQVEYYDVVECVDPQIDSSDLLKRAAKQLAAYTDIRQFSASGESIPKSQLILIGHSSCTLKELMAKGIIKISRKQRISDFGAVNNSFNPQSTLNPMAEDTASLVDKIFQKKVTLLVNHSRSVIEDIFLIIANKVTSKGDNLLLLYPDQHSLHRAFGRMERELGDRLFVYDNSVSAKQKLRTYSAARSKGVVVIGTRISVAMPFDSLGAVIVVQEHNRGHKNDYSPRFSARDSAVMLGAIYECPVILESITPSMESYNNYLNGKYDMVRLGSDKEFLGDKKITVINSFDIDKESGRTKKRGSEDRFFSKYLTSRMDSLAQSGNMVFVYKNQIGYSRYLLCSHCGYVPSCDNCNISLSYDSSKNRLFCSICGFAVSYKDNCLRCSSQDVDFMGFGTQNIEQKIAEIVPQLRISRFDSDTLNTKSAIRDAVKIVDNKEVDVVVGTSLMLGAVGIDSLALGAIVDADTLLNSSDFRAEERFYQLSFDLLSKSEELVIQSYKTNSEIIKNIAARDYKLIYDTQLVQRKEFGYPPYVRFVNIIVKHRDSLSVESICGAMNDWFGHRVPTDRVSLSVPIIDKIRGEWVMNVLIKIYPSDNFSHTKGVVAQGVEFFRNSKYFRDFKIVIDVDPQ